MESEFSQLLHPVLSGSIQEARRGSTIIHWYDGPTWLSSSPLIFQSPAAYTSQAINNNDRMSYAKSFNVEGKKRTMPESFNDSPKKQRVEDAHKVEDTFISRTDLKAMSWDEKKSIFSRNWNVQVVLCKGDASKTLLNKRIHFLKERLLAIPDNGGFVYAGDVELFKAKGAGVYKVRIAFALESPASYQHLVKALGQFDCPDKEESPYYVDPFPGFPYWGLLTSVHDRHYPGTLISPGPLYTRGEPRNTYTPIKYVLTGLEPHGTPLP